MLKDLSLTRKQWVVVGVLAGFMIFRYIFYSSFKIVIEDWNNILIYISSELLKIIGINAFRLNHSIILQNGLKLDVPHIFLNIRLIYVITLIVICQKRFRYRDVLTFFIWTVGAHIVRVIIWGVLVANSFVVFYTGHDKLYSTLLCIFPILFFSKNIQLVLKRRQRLSVEFISLKLCMILFLYYFSFFIIDILGDGEKIIHDSLAKGILMISKHTLEYLGYFVEITGRKIFNATTYVSVGNVCVGVDIILVFCGILLLTEKVRWDLVLYSIIGIVVLFFFNAMRITYLFVYMHEHGSFNREFDVHHDIYNVFIYSIVVLLWYLWFFYYKKEDSLDGNQ